jgi:hypothetical protein
MRVVVVAAALMLTFCPGGRRTGISVNSPAGPRHNEARDAAPRLTRFRASSFRQELPITSSANLRLIRAPRPRAHAGPPNGDGGGGLGRQSRSLGAHCDNIDKPGQVLCVVRHRPQQVRRGFLPLKLLVESSLRSSCTIACSLNGWTS